MCFKAFEEFATTCLRPLIEFSLIRLTFTFLKNIEQWLYSICFYVFSLFTPGESEKQKSLNDKHQRQFSLSLE